MVIKERKKPKITKMIIPLSWLNYLGMTGTQSSLLGTRSGAK
jgi:hypothetical protein